MFAIVEIAGKQYKVEQGQEIFVHRLEGNEGDNKEVGRVLLTTDGDNVTIGEPNLGSVTATILEHVKDDKVIVFKKKRRKGYKVKKGHRQALTKIKIDNI